MTFTYYPSTDIGRVRRTIPDKDSRFAIWSDEEIQSFLTDEGDWRRASAAALEAMASDNVLVLKVIEVQGLKTSGDRVSKALLERAALIRTQAAESDGVEVGGNWDIAEIVTDEFGYRQRIVNDVLKNSL